MAARPRLRPALSAAALSLALLAAACAPGPGAPSVLDGLLTGAEDGQAIVTPRGPLALSRWPAERPRAVLLALHGYGDYGPSTYGAAASEWAARGIEVYAYDQRGFGRNASNRRWPGPEALIEDLEAAARDVQARHPDLPLFVAGHSMGGGVALAAAGEGRLPGVAGVVLLAPAVWGGETMNPLFRASAWTAAQIVPDQRFSARASPVTIYPSDNIEMLRALSADPLHYANPSSREFLGLIRLMDRAWAAAPQDRIDTLVVHGAHDQVVPERSVRAAFERLPGPKEFAYVSTGWHMLLRDLEARTVHRLVGDWILARGLPPTASATPAD
ncbi:alpha/beta fold hydrolase [Albimonas pacifica]|uniref:Lysophospholipase, alpha-beta hydrolase superfamily n=1 Tax=Albimonas pacifica TaxID=1114924 RepID=A0A1I3F5S9_9RHOB|nr:alpha/beta fold hydrolase [Albimonas pacifica]SFI06595.1 Lysophospholipase, alpha-beta hydrolase superfamily [Albimonas pacifica]